MYTGIDQIVLREGYAAAAVCNLLEVSRSGFYAWRSTQDSRRAARDQELLPVIEEVWVGDITYIPLGTRTSTGRFGYLSQLMDLCSRKIVGWEYGSSMAEELVLGALRRAIEARQPRPGLIHHTDRGGQYASRRYRAVLRRSGMQQSISAAENCYDNAFMESCFGTVKTELELVEYANGPEAVRELTSYIRYYNGDRRHSSLGYTSPAEFERQQTIT